MENEFDAPENGVKQMREALDRQADKNKKLGIGFNTQQTYIFKREEYGSMAD